MIGDGKSATSTGPRQSSAQSFDDLLVFRTDGRGVGCLCVQRRCTQQNANENVNAVFHVIVVTRAYNKVNSRQVQWFSPSTSLPAYRHSGFRRNDGLAKRYIEIFTKFNDGDCARRLDGKHFDIDTTREFRYPYTEMKYTQYTLLKNGLWALPVFTAFVGAMVGYFMSSAHNLYAGDAVIWQQFAKDIALGGFIGGLIGLTIMFFGHATLDNVKVEDDPRYKDKRRAGSSSGIQSMVTKVYEKADLDDHKKSTAKVASKYKEKADAEKAEKAQILEMGTKGIEEKRKAALGIKSSAVDKSGVKKSGVNKSSVKKPGGKK